jgi:hypothetical protein
MKKGWMPAWLMGLPVWAAAGCAPAGFEQAVSYYADQHRVRDAEVRRVRGSWDLRFDSLLISDLEEAIDSAEPSVMRSKAEQVVSAAAALAKQSVRGELERMPPAGRQDLAKRGATNSDPDTLAERYAAGVDERLEVRLKELRRAGPTELRKYLRSIRRSIEPPPDDKWRGFRQLMLAWGAAPAWLGVEATEKTLEEDLEAHSKTTFEQFLVFERGETYEDGMLSAFSPTIIQQWPTSPPYEPRVDLFGSVYLAGNPSRIEVKIATDQPAVYGYTSEAKINGRRHKQLVYVWWYPERPPMKANDPAAGRIDGDTMRITLDSRGRPAIIEILQACGCGHLVFVAERIEKAAQAEFGGALPGKSFAVEKDVPGKRDLIVGGQFEAGSGAARPVVHVMAGVHSITTVEYEPPGDILAVPPARQRRYRLIPYDALKRLPLGNGVASMFGADGLVHNAGRKEGYLLAPTGMLSAGQPRMRGTQKIRWDEYQFSDPHLLEKCLRLPSRF